MLVPKVIHKFIITEDGKIPTLPEGMKRAIESFYRMNPDYKIKMYSGNDCVEYIKKYYDEDILKTYESLKPYAYKSDFIRHLVLLREGGWHTDLRMVCLQPLDILNNQNKQFYACIDTPQKQLCMCNGFIGVVPGHAITQKMIDIISWNVKQKHYGIDCLYPTGPGAYMNACIDYIRKHSEKCMIGKHVIESGEQMMYFSNVRLLKVKYNDAKGANNDDLPGSNDYGDMWRNYQVYSNNDRM